MDYTAILNSINDVLYNIQDYINLMIIPLIIINMFINFLRFIRGK